MKGTEEENYDKLIQDIRPKILEKLSRDNLLPLYIVKAVIDNQFSTAAVAFTDPKNRVVELPGIGRFLFHEKRAKCSEKKFEDTIERYNNVLKEEGISETVMAGILDRITLVNKLYNSLKKKIYGNQSDNRGLEK